MSFRFVQAAAFGLTLAVSTAAASGPAPASLASNFNGTPISQGNYIWFNSVVSVQGQNGSSDILSFNSSTITFTLGGSPVTLNVPAAVITFSAGASTATSVFNQNTNTWVTSVPLGYTGNVFLSGLAYAVPANFPTGLNPVTWSGSFFGSSSGLTAQWQWAAAVYQGFNSNMSDLGVKPVDSNSISSYQNSDHAGTPESYESSVRGGARGGGGSNYTGSYSGTGAPTVNPGQTPVFTSSGAPQNLVVGQNFSFTVSATYGTSYAATSLPPGLTLSGAGVLSGTPTTTGTWSAVITATNTQSGSSTAQTLALSVYATPAFTSGNPAQTLLTGQAFNFTASATNSATFSATSLPPGLSISSAGVISGTPTAVGTWVATLTAANAWGSATQTLAFTVNQSSAGSGNDTVLGTSVFSYTGSSANYTAPAGTDYVIIKAWGAGGGCGSSGSGGDGSFVQSSCNLSAGGQCSVQVGCGGSSSSSGGWPDGRSAGGGGCGGGGGSTQVSCSAGSVSAAGGCGGDNQGHNGTPGGCGNQGYQGNQFQYQSNNCTGGCGGGWASAQGSCFNSTIQCGGNGTPPHASDTNYPGNNCASGGCGGRTDGCGGGCVIIACHRGALAPVMTCGSTASGLVGQSFTYAITASNATSYGATTLPSGLVLNATTGVISGAPAAVGTYPVTLTATNSSASATAPLTVTITANYTLAITSSPAGAGTASGAGTYTSGTTAAIVETPAAGYAAAGWTGPDGGAVAAPASASTSILMSANRTLVANFTAITPVFTSSSAAQVLVVGQPCSFQAAATESPAFSATALPSGLVISNAGLITGTPTAAGNWSSSITANNHGATASQTLPMAVYAQPVITSSLSVSQPISQPISYAITATGSPTTFSAAGLPSGVTVNTATGLISGTPAQAGNYTVNLSASNPGATGTATLVLAVNPVVTSALTVTAKLNEPFTYPIGGVGATTYSATGLPAGILVNTTTGVISGNPTVTGTFPVQIGVQGYGASGSATLTLTVLPTYALTITGSAAAGTYSGAGTYDPGTVVTVTETPGAGYRTSGWGGPDAASTASPSSASTTIVMSANRSLTAKFVQQAVLTVTAGTGGSATGGGTYDVGTVVPITATPAGSYAFTNWGGTGLANPAAAATSVTLAASETVTANFTSTYTLSIAGSAGGTFSGTGTYPAGTVVTVTETPNAGYRTSAWTGPDAGSMASPSSPSTTIVMSANRSLTANFVQQVVLTVNTGTGGTATGAGTYDVGTIVPLTETAAAGYRTGGWTGPDGASTASPSSAATTIVMSASRSVTANFVRQFVLTVTPGTGGTASGGGTYDIGSTVPITETPNAGYRAGGWGGPDAASTASVSSAATTIVMSANRSLTANFVQQGVLTVTAGTGGTATGSGTYDVGSVVPITATPAATYLFNDWGGTGLANAAAASTTVTIAGNETVTANFTATYTLSITGSAGGTFSGAGTYPAGTVVTVTETPDAGYRTSAWTGPDAGSVASPSSSSTTIVMSANRSLVANFVQQFVLTVTAGTGGTATGGGTYDIGATVPITETAGAGYRTGGWTGPDGASTAAPGSASTTIVMSANRSVTASFVQQVVLTVTAGTGGTATGGGTFDIGTTAPITETAAAGYRASGWGGPDGASTASPSSASTTIVLSANMNVVASFVQQVVLTVTAGTGGTAAGGGTYDLGSVVPISETANAGYRTAGWGGPDGASTASPTSASTTIVMSGNLSVAATFVQQAVLTVVAGTGGTAAGGGTFDLGSTVTIAATASSNYDFSDWTGATPPTDPNAASTTIALTGDTTVTANFTKIVHPPTAVITAAPTAYTGSPFTVTSTASAQDDDLTLHSVEWLSPSGAWTVDSAAASGGTSNRTVGITFPSTGTWTLRAGASVDNGVTWVYSPTTQVVVSSGLATYVLESMAVPSASAVNWYLPSPVVQKTYQVLHTNP